VKNAKDSLDEEELTINGVTPYGGVQHSSPPMGPQGNTSQYMMDRLTKKKKKKLQGNIESLPSPPLPCAFPLTTPI